MAGTSMDKLEAALAGGGRSSSGNSGGRPNWQAIMAVLLITLAQSLVGALVWRMLQGFFKARGWNFLLSPVGNYLLLVAIAAFVDLKAPRFGRWVRDLAIGVNAVSFVGDIVQSLAKLAK